MFFPNRIRSIRPGDRVLEVGPGGSPHPRADVLLDRYFDDQEAFEQRGRTAPPGLRDRMVYYQGGDFPFDDNEFDYVICSHVIEHVDDVEAFCSEMFRVASSGYLEFPTVYYEYLYNFRVHTQLVMFVSGELRYLPKNESGLEQFASLQAFFHRSLELGYSDLVEELQTVMFHGFEWAGHFPVRRVTDIRELAGELDALDQRSKLMRIAMRALRFIERYLG